MFYLPDHPRDASLWHPALYRLDGSDGVAHVSNRREAYNAQRVERLFVLLHTLSDKKPGRLGPSRPED